MPRPLTASRYTIASLLSALILAGAGCSNGGGSSVVGGGGMTWPMDHVIVDAEYDRAHDHIVTVSDSPYRLYVLDPDTRTSESVALSLAPHCVSVNADGTYAAVGHLGFISYVNLATMTVERVYNVSCDVSDIVLASNGFVYSVPRRDQWETVRCTNLSTGEETLELGSIRADSRMKLHASGDYLYAADRGSSPSDFTKRDIRSGTAVYLYDSPYHGDYDFDGDLWMSDDGLRVFARSGNVFRTSEVQAEDLIFNGQLSDASRVHSLDVVSAQDRVFVVPAPADDDDPVPGVVHIYDYETLTLDSVVELPGFTVEDGGRGTADYGAEGAYVFADSSGTKFHALYRADSNSGLVFDWALATYNVNSGFDDGEPVAPELVISDQDITFDCETSTHTVTLSNPGTDALEWEASAEDPRISLSVSSGTLLAGGSQTLVITLNPKTRGVSDTSEIVFTTDTLDTKSIAVRVDGIAPCADPKWKMDHLIIDAEYDRDHNVIVTVSDAPYGLHILDPNSRSSASVALSHAPQCVSVSPDGTHAAVGHNGFVSYVNLDTRTVEQVYPVSCDVFDIVLAPNGFVYAVPRSAPPNRLSCIHLATGVVTLSTDHGITGPGSRIKLHPSGNYIYTANNHVSPMDIGKTDIRPGIADFMYDSPYHGDFEFSGDLWMSDDGSRVFTRSSNVFSSTEVRATDMVFAGRLSDEIAPHSLDASSAANWVFAVPEATKYEGAIPGTIHVYRYDYLTLESVVELPTFSAADGNGGTTEHGARGAYVFADSSGTAFHALYRANEASGLLYDWAIATYDVHGGFRREKPIAPELVISHDDLRFDCFTQVHNVTISNPGTDVLHWVATPDPRVTLSSYSGTLLPGSAMDLIISVDRSSGDPGASDTVVDFNTNTSQVETIAIHLADLDDCDNIRWPLNHTVLDADYDRIHDRIITVSQTPNRLNVLDPNTRTGAVMDLPMTPTSLSVRPDGLYAAVGHVGYFSYVNLTTMSIERIYDVSSHVFDIALASNGLAYSVSRGNQWGVIHHTDLSTGAESKPLISQILEHSVLRLHPSGDTLYAANTIGCRVMTFDITTRLADNLGDEAYESGLQYPHNMWLSDDGLRIFTEGGNVFRASRIPEQDMAFNGRLSDGAAIHWMDSASAQNLVYVVPGRAPGQYEDPIPGLVRVYNNDYLTPMRTVALPAFPVPDGDGGAIDYPAQGGYVFADSSGSTFHALYQAHPDADLPFDWSVATYDLTTGYRDGVTQASRLTISPLDLVFQCYTVSQTITVANSGTETLEWNAVPEDARISLSSISGTLAPGQAEDVIATIDWDAAGTTAPLSEITFTTDALEVASVSVRIVGTCANDQWSLDHLVIDAEYDPINDAIVTVSESPNQLNVLDPSAQTATSVSLSETPTCVSIRPDGQYAAVGHDGSISYVNLLTMTVEQVYPVSADVLDIVLASNGFVFSMPRGNERLRSTELSTGDETVESGLFIPDADRIKLHPSGTFIYGAAFQSGQKHSIQTGPTAFLYESERDYYFGGNLWITDDGLRIFAQTGYVFSSSATRGNDMQFSSQLPGNQAAHWVAPSLAAGLIFVVPDRPRFDEPVPGQINLYSYDFLNFDSIVELPDFTVPDGNGGFTEVDSEGAFVFANAAGTKFYALYHAVEGSGILLDWAVSAFSIEP